MRRLRLRFPKHFFRRPFFLVFVFVATIILAFALYNLSYVGKNFPNVLVAGHGVGGLSEEETTSFLSQNIAPPEKIRLTYQSQEIELETKNIDLSYDFSSSSERAYGYARSGNIFFDMYERAKLIFSKKNIGLKTNFNADKLKKFISVVAGQYSQEAVYPSIKLTSGKIQVSKGVDGSIVNQTGLEAKIVNNLSLTKSEDIAISVTPISVSLTDKEVENVKDSASKYVGKSIKAKFEYYTYTLSDSDIVALINPKDGFDDDGLSQKIAKITSEVNREPQNPKFDFNDGKVTAFQPAIDGARVKELELKNKLIESLNSLPDTADKEIVFDIPVTKTSPGVTTESVNNLGIRELIGRGTSTYFHSIPSRVHNVVLAASRINGTLIKPGETFSFNDTLGDVSQFTGYQQAYVISGGKTILGDGGGVCQVSTTLFRAALNAGLPIEERTAHAYRVGYYEQGSAPGLDATVYGPSPDLKIKNDTPAYILIEAKADPKHYSLVFELYGTSDGRVATITKPIVSNVTPALPTVYQDDPSLKTGVLKQIDFSAAGAKVTFNYSVSRNGERIIQKTFVSNYRPWAAVYLRGTGSAI